MTQPARTSRTVALHQRPPAPSTGRFPASHSPLPAARSGRQTATGSGVAVRPWLPRAGRLVDDWTPFGGLFPRLNPQALRCYYLSVLTLIPVAGMLIALEVLASGLHGLAASRRLPHHQGWGHAVFGLLFALASLLLHLAWIAAAWQGWLA